MGGFPQVAAGFCRYSSLTMNRKSIAPAVVVWAVLPSCINFGASAHVGFTRMQLDGTMALNAMSGGIPVGTLKNDVGDFGLDDESDSLYGRVELDGGPVSVTASAFRFQESGSGDLVFQFGNIAAGTTVNSDIELKNLKAALFLDLIDIAGVRIAPGVGADIFDVEMMVTDTTTMMSDEIDELLPMPMVFLKGEVAVGRVTATLDAGYIEADLDDMEGTFWDLEGLLRLRVTGNLEVFGGYRYINIDSEGSSDGQDFDVDLELDGWIVGGGVSF